MRSCNNCNVHRCNRFNKKNDPVAICPKYEPMQRPKVKLRDLVSNIVLDNPSPVVLRYFMRWA
jgi:hypothetical protein